MTQKGILSVCYRIYSFLKTNYQIQQLIRITGCQVIHCNDSSALWHTGFGARIMGASVLFNVRDIKPPKELYGYKWHIAWRVSNQLLVLSREMREALISRLAIPSSHQHKVDYIYSIVDMSKMQPVNENKKKELRSQLGIASDSFAIGYVATFNPKKNQLQFIEEAAHLLKATVPNAKLYFVGDFYPNQNSYARSCLEAVKRLQLEDIIQFIGYTPEIDNWYKALDTVVLASRNEGLARCMIESLACGTPVVSFDVCSAREILEAHECGFVVDQGDYVTLVQQIRKLAEDVTTCQAFGKNGASIAKAIFDPTTIVNQYENLYKTIVTNKVNNTKQNLEAPCSRI